VQKSARLHCDPTASHYLRILMDAILGLLIFGMKSFGEDHIQSVMRLLVSQVIMTHARYANNTDNFPLVHPYGSVQNLNTSLVYFTIQSAINAPETLDSDTIFVGNGTCYENVKINNSISLIGEDKETTTIDGGARAKDALLIGQSRKLTRPNNIMLKIRNGMENESLRKR